MELAILLKKEDIQTNKMGLHYEIRTPNGITINFSPDALDEFMNDIKSIKEDELIKPEFPSDRIEWGSIA